MSGIIRSRWIKAGDLSPAMETAAAFRCHNNLFPVIGRNQNKINEFFALSPGAIHAEPINNRVSVYLLPTP